MFTPTYRLILFAALLAPLTVFAALSTNTLTGILILYAALIGTAVFDLLASRHSLHSLSVQANSPVRLSKDNPGKIEVFITREGAHPQQLRLGLPLPAEFANKADIQHVFLAKDKHRWALHWHSRPTRRGIYSISTLYGECTSKYGLWSIRRAFPLQLEVRVYPNLRRDQNQLANLFLNRGLNGMHPQRVVGKGREYDRLRAYVPGDSVLDLHWKASAKRNHLVTKTYQVERTQEIYMLIDHSRLSGRQLDNQAETVLERFVTAASVLGLATERSGDLFGLITFSDRINTFVRASSGRSHQQSIQDAIFGLSSEPVPPDYDELLTFLRIHLRRRALLIILTDLSDPAVADAFCQKVHLITRQHCVVVNMLQEADVARLFNPDATVNSDQDIYQQLAGHLRWRDVRERQLALRHMGVDLKWLPQERLSVDIVNQYIRIKQKQLL